MYCYPLIITVCEDCNEVYHGDCTVHGPLGRLDTSTGHDQDSVMYTTVPVPAEATIKTSSIPEAGLGVFAKKLIPRHVRVGPYEGKRLSVEDMEMVGDTSYIWEVSKKISHVSLTAKLYTIDTLLFDLIASLFSCILPQIRKDKQKAYYIDGRNAEDSNWLRFVNCARLN